MKLSYGERKSMPKKEFALPGKREGGKGGYPIEDKAHARDALTRVAQHGTPAEKKEVRAKVHDEYPSIDGRHEPKGNSRHYGRPKTPRSIESDKHFHKIGM
jgi:hypothetical protein